MNIQQLRVQIEALQSATMDENKNFRSAYDEGKFDALSAVDALLDSLQEEPVSEDLEEEINRYLSYRSSSPQNPIEFNRDLARHFANWQKQQMMKEAVDARVQLETCGHGSMCLGLSLPFGVLENMKLKEGNNVKLIIIKED